MKALSQKNTCTLIFTAARFTMAKTWEQPKCPSADKKMYMYTQWSITQPLKKEYNYAIGSKIDGPGDYHTKSDKDKYHMISLICGI